MNHLFRIGSQLAIVLAGLSATVPLAASTVSATAANFDQVFASAGAGDTITMLGAFGEVRMANRVFAQKITLDASKAVFSSQMVVDNVSGMQVIGGIFNIGGNGAYAKAAAVWGGSNIYFRFLTVNGGVDQFGISFSGTRNAQVTNSNFTGLSSGVAFGSVVNGFAARDNFSGSFSDGIDIADSQGVTASWNRCADGNPSPGAHPDCIQMWSVAGHPLESDIVVTNNVAIGPTQGFTDFDAGLRLNISNNTVASSYIAGIACYSCVNSIITNNIVSTLPGSPYQTQVVIWGGSGNTVSNNSVATYLAPLPSISSLDANTLISQYSPPSFSSFLFQKPFTESVDLAVGSGLLQEGVAAIPETSTWALLIIGFISIGLAQRRAFVPYKRSIIL